jgi:anti-sigma factor RsiW
VTCREFADFMMDYLAGELPQDSLASFDRHLRVCENCQQYLAGYRESVKLGQRAFDRSDAELPADVPDDLVKAILAARRPS